MQLNVQIQLLEERIEKLNQRNKELEKRKKLLEVDKYTHHCNLYGNKFMIGIVVDYMAGSQFSLSSLDDKLIEAVQDTLKAGKYSPHMESYKIEVLDL